MKHLSVVDNCHDSTCLCLWIALIWTRFSFLMEISQARELNYEFIHIQPLVVLITANSGCHIKFWFMRPFPVVVWGQVILLQGAENFKNIWTLVCIGSDIFRRRFCSHGLSELLNAPLLMIMVVYWILIWQWEQIKTFGLSSFGQFFHLEQWPERFSCSRCKCPNTRNALSAV